MKNKVFVFLLAMTSMLLQNAIAQPIVSKKQFHLYLLAGQSNMAGRGKVETEDTTRHPRVWVLTKNNDWQLAAEPLHFDKPTVVGVGIGFAFAKKMAELDTNIVIDFLGERELFYEASAKIVTLADQKKVKVFTSPTSITNVYYILSKFESSKTALEKIRKFKLLCDISIMDNEVVEKAIHSGFKDFEDAMQYFSAISSNCELIITRNEKDFKNALIPVMNAEF